MKLFALLFALFSVAAAAREPFSFDRNSKAIKSHGKGRLSEHNVEHVIRKNAELKKRLGDFNPPPATASTVVGAQLRCSGFMCPQWALDVTRWDMVVGDGENPEWQLIELLPVAPTWQRMPNIFTDYDASTRMYTVCVQSYPAPGVDTFFQVQISDDISGARMVSNNVIVAHPDTSSNQPGSMSLVRMFDSPDPNGGIVAIFNDGSIYNLDLLATGDGSGYKLLGSLKTDPSVAGTFVAPAHVFDGMVLKSFLTSQDEIQSYLVTFDLSTNKATAPVALQPVQGGGKGYEVPTNAHIIDNGQGTGTNVLALIMAGQFDQIIQIDESTGAQNPLIFSITEGTDINEEYPAILYCDEGTKDCDMWTTSAYDPATKQIYIQAHYIDPEDVYWTMIYKQNWLKYTAQDGMFAFFSPVCYMDFGYHGYQFVTVANGATKAPIPARAAHKGAQAATNPEAKKHHLEDLKSRRHALKSSVSDVPADVRDAAAAHKIKLQSKSPQGTIIAAQYYKEAQSTAHSLRISATYPIGQVGVSNDVMLQTLLTELTQDNAVHTAYDANSRTFYVCVDNYPRPNEMMAWASTISAKADAATPVVSSVVMTYPASSSPVPLNVITPSISRTLVDANGALTVIFKNGEVHTANLQTKTFTKQLMLISQDDLYGVSHPYATGSQVIDTANGKNTLYSFIFGASNVFMTTVDMETKSASAYVGPLDMPGTQDLSTGFSPEFLIDAHMLPLTSVDSTKQPQQGLLMMMESLPETGFDELNFVDAANNATLIGPVYNLMEETLVFECFSYNCDMWRNSAYDAADETLYFQAHLEVGNEISIVLGAMVLVKSLVNDRFYWVVNNHALDLGFGYTGMHWATFA